MTRAPFSFCLYNAGLDCHVLRVHSGAVLNSPNQTQQWLIFVGQMAVIQVGMWCQRAFFWYIFIFSWLAKKVSAWTLEQSGVSCFSSGEINNTEQTYELWTVEKVLSWKFFFPTWYCSACCSVEGCFSKYLIPTPREAAALGLLQLSDERRMEKP